MSLVKEVSRCLDNSLGFDQWKGYSALDQM